MAGHSILIVEDEDNIALALEHHLGRQGHRLTRVSDGSQVMAEIARARPDLVLLDVMLPGLSGYEVCQQIRQDPALAGTRILIMTARGTAIERRKGLALGADDFITKPFRLSDLGARVDALLQGGHSDED